MAQHPCLVTIPDDSGFLAIVDPTAYLTFVDNDWTLRTLFQHFRSEMNRRTLLLWETGREDTSKVQIDASAARARHAVFRQITGPIRVTGEALLLVNYEMLTMVAQFEDESLDGYTTEYGVELPNGDYACTISQVADPDTYDNSERADFLIHLARGDAPRWTSPAWAQP